MSSTHVCITLCRAQIIYIHSTFVGMSMTCSHLGIDDRPLANDTCRETLDMAYECVANEVLKTPTSKNSAIVMISSKRLLTDYLFKSLASGEHHHLVGSFLEVVMDKFNTLASPNCSMWLSSIWQSELFHSSSQFPSNSWTHRGIVEFCNSWCGSYYILVRDWLSCIQITHYNITTQLNQTMLGIACHYRHYVQCQSRDWEI